MTFCVTTVKKKHGSWDRYFCDIFQDRIKGGIEREFYSFELDIKEVFFFLTSTSANSPPLV
jgi:hypothetical protein